MLNRIKIFLTIWGWVLSLLLCFPQPAWGGEPSARDIISRAYAKTGLVDTYEADVYFYLFSIQSFPPEVFGSLSSTSILRGKFVCSMPDRCELNLFLPDGRSLNFSFSEGERFAPSPSGGGPSPEPEAKPSPATLPAPQNDYLSRSVFNLLVPLPLRGDITQYPSELAGQENINGQECYVIKSRGSFLGDCRLWVDRQDYLIRQINCLDPKGRSITAVYKTFATVGQGFPMATSVTVMQDNVSLFTAEFILTQNQPVIAETPGSPQPSPSAEPETPDITENNDNPVYNISVSRPLVGPPHSPRNEDWRLPFSFTDWMILFFSIAVLIYFGSRILDQLALKSQFSRELIVVDKERGELLKILREAGYQGVEFTPEILTEERRFLARPPQGVLPRAVVIAENSIREIKQYMYLLRAYLEEGGRVLIFPHGKEFIPDLPFTPEYFPYDPETIGRSTLLVRNPGIWSEFSNSLLSARTSSIMPSEVMLKIDQEWISRELVTLQNQVLGLNAVVMGIQKMKKGEILICQYHLLPVLLKEGGRSDSSKVLIDLLSYLQRRPEDRSF